MIHQNRQPVAKQSNIAAGQASAEINRDGLVEALRGNRPGLALGRLLASARRVRLPGRSLERFGGDLRRCSAGARADR